MIDGVVGRRISQDPGHAIGRHCDVPERLRGRPSSQILDSRRLQRHENHASILENSLPSSLLQRPRGGPANLVFVILEEASAVVIAPPPPPPPSLSTSERKLDAAAKEKRATLFYAPGSRVGTVHCRMSPRDQPAFTHGIRNGLCFRQGPFLAS